MTVFETTLFVLALVKSVQMSRPRGDNGRTPSIITVLFRDSILYFGGVVTAIVTNLVIWAAARVRSESSAPLLFIADHTAAVSVRRVHRVRGPATLSSLRLMFSHQERVRYPLYLGLSDAGKTWMSLVRF